MQLNCKRARSENSDSRPSRRQLRHFTVLVLLMAGIPYLLYGCAAIPLSRLLPVVATPDSACGSKHEYSFLSKEPPALFHYVYHPVGQIHHEAYSAAPVAFITTSKAANGALFEDYRSAIRATVQSNLPSGLKNHSVTVALTEFLTSVSGEAQLDAQIADGTLKPSDQQITIERKAIRKHSGPRNLTHGEMKDFADKLFDLQLKPGAAALAKASADKSSLDAKDQVFLKAHPAADATFIAYFEAYYNGKFIDRMSMPVAKPTVSTTIPDSEIVAAETVLLEFLIDSIDATPVMGADPPGSVTKSTIFYPGNTTGAPTAYVTNPEAYIQIPPGSDNACGITTTNAWVLKDLANGASDQAAAVGGLVANTAGGISIGLGVLGKISIGDNQTLSVMVKTAASRVALRATLASSYWTLRHVKFNVKEPGT